MPNRYTLIVQNNTGATQDYSFFSSPPVVSGGGGGGGRGLWPTLEQCHEDCQPYSERRHRPAQIWTDYYAICGSHEGSAFSGAQVTISKSVPISLGSKVGSSVSLGSTIAMTVADDKTACDLGPPTTPGQGKIGNYQLRTGNGQFSIQDAKDNNLLVGIANSKGGNIFAAMGSFTPYPNSTYQIQPSAVLNVASGSRFQAGALVTVEQMGNSMAVDFNIRQTNKVTLIHNDQLLYDFA